LIKNTFGIKLALAAAKRTKQKQERNKKDQTNEVPSAAGDQQAAPKDQTSFWRDLFPEYQVPFDNPITYYSFFAIFFYGCCLFSFTFTLMYNEFNTEQLCRQLAPIQTAVIQLAYFSLILLMLERARLVDNFSSDPSDHITNQRLVKAIRYFSYFFGLTLIVNVPFAIGKLVVSSDGKLRICVGSFPLFTMIPFMVFDMIISVSLFVAFYRPLKKVLEFRKNLKVSMAGHAGRLFRVVKRNIISFFCILFGTSGTAGTSILFGIQGPVEFMLFGFLWVAICGFVLAIGLLAITLSSWKARMTCCQRDHQATVRKTIGSGDSSSRNRQASSADNKLSPEFPRGAAVSIHAQGMSSVPNSQV
jgi:hypothetical protein